MVVAIRMLFVAVVGFVALLLSSFVRSSASFRATKHDDFRARNETHSKAQGALKHLQSALFSLVQTSLATLKRHSFQLCPKGAIVEHTSYRRTSPL